MKEIRTCKPSLKLWPAHIRIPFGLQKMKNNIQMITLNGENILLQYAALHIILDLIKRQAFIYGKRGIQTIDHQN